MAIMQRPRFQAGTRVLVQPEKRRPQEIGLVTDGPMIVSGDPFFKVETSEIAAWYSVEHIRPYLRVVE